MDYKSHLRHLHEQQWWQQFMEEVLIPSAPSVPEYNPSKDNTERWKYDSAMRAGYYEALRKLGIGVSNGNPR